jgi:hypothetical protein
MKYITRLKTKMLFQNRKIAFIMAAPRFSYCHTIPEKIGITRECGGALFGTGLA